MTPVVSLIVCTRDRAAKLEKCLAAISRLKFDQPWELIIVDNGSKDQTAEVARRFVAGVNFPAQYVYEPLPGLGLARNSGLRASSGDLIAFTDDDCYVAEDYLQRTVEAFADPEIGYITGRILLHDREDYPASINESTDPVTFAPRKYIRAGAVKGASMSFRREALFAVKGFDPLFGSGALFPAEDCDAAARVSLRGWTGKYVPEVVVSQHHGRKADTIKRLWRDYDIGRGAYHAKLLLDEGAFAQAFRGWFELLHRARIRPATAYWELFGAFKFLSVTIQRRLAKGSEAGGWTAASPIH